MGGFTAGEISSDGGGLLLRQVEARTRIILRLSECFTDRRAPARIERELETLVEQRLLGIALGYEDLNDLDELCRERLLALLCGVSDLTGAGLATKILPVRILHPAQHHLLVRQPVTMFQVLQPHH